MCEYGTYSECALQSTPTYPRGSTLAPMSATLKIAATGTTTRTLANAQGFPLIPGEVQSTPDVLDKLPIYNDQNHLATAGSPQPQRGSTNR